LANLGEDFVRAVPFSKPLVTYYMAGADLRKKPLCPNLNHSIPEVGKWRFDRGTNNGSKTSHTSVNLGNMILLPTLAEQREFDPFKCGVVPVLDSHKEET
jgi:hypothetical protein